MPWEAMSPTFNHTRDDGPFAPCPVCLPRMTRADLLALVKDLRQELAEARQQLREHVNRP